MKYCIKCILPNTRPNLELTSITWNVKGTGGWWCGYGWKKHPNLRKERIKKDF